MNAVARTPSLVAPLKLRSTTQRKTVIVAGKASKLRQQRAEAPEEVAAPEPILTVEAASSSTPAPEAEEPPLLPADASAGETLKQYGIWLVSFLTVIGTFYSVVFYAGAGAMYFIRDNVDFTKKDFVPYSERLAMEAEVSAKREAEDKAIVTPAAPSLSSRMEAEESLRGLLPTK